MENLSAGAKRILIVEDEPAISAVCQRVLTSEGLEVDIAVNGKIAQDMIVEKQYDLYLLDIKTPVMDGKELYQWLKEKHPKQISKVIFTSGSVMGGDTQLFIKQIGRPFLPKPFTPDDLKTIIRETLEEVGK